MEDTVLKPTVTAKEKLILPQPNVAEETESESSGYGSYETDNGSGEEDQTDYADFDEVYMDVCFQSWELVHVRFLGCAVLRCAFWRLR
ncbi:unnamed protein product [Cuscuta europaea]|uniref:Uncharacterized protein n=1 Tax=Cuscuta europaea TaxID=41803 RepID=A0A9P0VMV5_CUSEU|nr:unnamed protein product [Cuscuta europaea]